jgi:hypothetical protein
MTTDNSFNSIERLMEFGLSIAIAQQMIQTMNYAMQTMHTPNIGQQISGNNPQRQYFALVNEIPQGPFSETEFMGYVQNQSITRQTLVWISGMKGWAHAESVPELSNFLH